MADFEWPVCPYGREEACTKLWVNADEAPVKPDSPHTRAEDVGKVFPYMTKGGLPVLVPESWASDSTILVDPPSGTECTWMGGEGKTVVVP